MNKGILFDLDGTLTDSGEGIMNCVQLALEHFGIPVPERDKLRVFVGPPLSDSFLRHGVPADKIEEAIAVYRSRYVPIGIFENQPYPGIAELLQELRRDGYALYVATSKPEKMAIQILEHFNLASSFDRICGATMDSSRSTKDAVIAYLLEQCPALQKMIMVGDTKYDVLGAAAHNIPTVGVSWGYGSVDEMETAGAVAIAHDTKALKEILDKL